MLSSRTTELQKSLCNEEKRSQDETQATKRKKTASENSYNIESKKR